MALASTLPVYIASYDLLLTVFRSVRQFDREYKYTIGQEIRMQVMAILRNIYHANSSWERRSEYIQNALEHIDALRIYIRLSRDLHVLSIAVFVDINTHIELVSRQLTGWDRGSRQRQSTETSVPGIVSR